jgi:hypothetical protein
MKANINAAGPGFSDLVDANLSLQKQRIAIYKNGSIPTSAYSDTYASQFLLDPSFWPQLAPAQQTAAIQNLSDLIDLVSAKIVAGNLPVETQTELMNTLTIEASSAADLANKVLNDPDLGAKMGALAQLGVSSPTPTIKIYSDNASKALHTTFSNLQPTVAGQ